MLGSGSIEFDNVREYLNQNRDVKRELEFAFTSLLAAANPTDRGTRFAFGGGAEWIMAATAWCAGVLMAPKGHNTNGFDLTDLRNKARGLWSVKASASPQSSDIRLINYMGDGKDNAAWTVPTLFVGPYFGGAVFINPEQEIEIQKKTRKTSDALTLRSKYVRDFSEDHPANHIAFDVAINEGKTQSASHAFIKSILTPEHFPKLSQLFTSAEPISRNTRLETIKGYVQLHEQGVISKEQLENFVADLVPSRTQRQ